MNFEFRIRPDNLPQARAFEASGSLDSSKALEALAQALRSDAARHLLVDFGRVTYVNSTGFGALVVLTHELREAGKALYILDPHPRVRLVFGQLGGDELPVYKAEDAAAAIRKSPPTAGPGAGKP